MLPYLGLAFLLTLSKSLGYFLGAATAGWIGTILMIVIKTPH